MNHKRGRAKNQRAGCLMCKPNKMNGWNKQVLGHTGFGKLRDDVLSEEDMRTFNFTEEPDLTEKLYD